MVIWSLAVIISKRVNLTVELTCISFSSWREGQTTKMNEYIMELVAIFSTATLLGMGVAALLKMFNLPFIWMHPVRQWQAVCFFFVCVCQLYLCFLLTVTVVFG